MLQMSVKVMKSTPAGAHTEEDTQTLVVNAHGGLLKLKMEVQTGQPIILVNPRNGKKQNCRVVRIEQPTPEYFAVAFEFDQPSPGFWPVTFPPSDWEAAGT
jgi:hypothetical protein